MARNDQKEKAASRRGSPTVLTGDAGLGWGFGPSVTSDEPTKPPAPEFDTVSTIDTGWGNHTTAMLLGFLQAAQPDDDGYTQSLCVWMESWLQEYMEEGISLDNLLKIARKSAARMPINNQLRYIFVGIIASAATSAVPQRTRTSRQGKTSAVLAQEAAHLVHINQFDEAGKQLVTNDAAIQAAHATLTGLLPEAMMPTPKTMAGWYQKWLREQGDAVPRPAIGTPKFG